MPIHRSKRTVVLSLAFAANWLAALSWGYSFNEQSITSGTDYAELGKASQHGGEDVLLGSYNGTSFSITLKKEYYPGMCSFPRGIRYGESSRYVWVYSHNRATDGTTLIDVDTGDSVFGAHGHGSDVSSDGRRIAYSINGMYGLFGRACVLDYSVYPEIAQMQRNDGGFTSLEVEHIKRPQMAMTAYHKWLDNDTICFVHGEHTRVAEQANMPGLAKYWFVQVDGVGEGMSTDTIKASRARLTDDEVKRLSEARVTGKVDWPFRDLAEACKGRMAPVMPDSFDPDVFNHPDWPVLPLNAEVGVSSPDGSHIFSLGRDRIETDMSYGVVLMVDGEEVASWPLGRVLALPVWTNDSSAQVLIHAGWVAKVLTGKGETTDSLVSVSISKDSNRPRLTIQKIFKADAEKRVEEARSKPGN